MKGKEADNEKKEAARSPKSGREETQRSSLSWEACSVWECCPGHVFVMKGIEAMGQDEDCGEGEKERHTEELQRKIADAQLFGDDVFVAQNKALRLNLIKGCKILFGVKGV